MDEHKNKQSEEILAEIYRNAQLALQSISNLLPEVEDEVVKNLLLSQHEEYEKFSAEAAMLAKDRDILLKEPNPLKKAMMWGSIKMSALKDNSRSHVAEMMVQGTVMGITALRSSKSDVVEGEEEEIVALLDKMIKSEELYEKKWKEYL